MLRRPRFDESRLQIEKGNILESMRQRNDDADDILGREWGFLLYGKDHYSSRRMTEASLDAISRADLVAFHEKYWRPENMVIAVSGDVDTNAFLSKLENYLADWPGEGAEANWPPPQPTHTVEPGVYSVEKDIPQGKVLIGHLVPQWTDWDNPDRAALQVMEHILGGSGFTSRIMKRVRSDEGLAYSAGSQFSFDALEPGTFTISFQSKSPTVALAARIALEEVTRIQSEPVTAEELGVAKSSLIDTFPRRFESARQRAGIFATDAYLGRSHAYWQNWRPQIEAVTADDVMRVAKEYLSPENIVFLVVGKWEEIAPGDPDDRANMMEFFGGEVTNIPLRDPLTLE
jgi:predicted Zn-dependent peptidase